MVLVVLEVEGASGGGRWVTRSGSGLDQCYFTGCVGPAKVPQSSIDTPVLQNLLIRLLSRLEGVPFECTPVF